MPIPLKPTLSTPTIKQSLKCHHFCKANSMQKQPVMLWCALTGLMARPLTVCSRSDVCWLNMSHAAWMSDVQIVDQPVTIPGTTSPRQGLAQIQGTACQANSMLGAADSMLGAADSMLGAANSMLGAANSMLGAANSMLGAADSMLGAANSMLGAANSMLGAANSMLGAA